MRQAFKKQAANGQLLAAVFFHPCRDPVGLLVRVAAKLGQSLLGSDTIGENADQKTVAVIILSPEFENHQGAHFI